MDVAVSLLVKAIHGLLFAQYVPTNSLRIALLWTSTEAEISLFCGRCPYQYGYFSIFVLLFPGKMRFEKHFVPYDWKTIVWKNDLPMEPFPQREETDACKHDCL